MALRSVTSEDWKRRELRANRIFVSKWRKRAQLPSIGQHRAPTWPLETSQTGPSKTAKFAVLTSVSAPFSRSVRTSTRLAGNGRMRQFLEPSRTTSAVFDPMSVAATPREQRLGAVVSAAENCERPLFWIITKVSKGGARSLSCSN